MLGFRTAILGRIYHEFRFANQPSKTARPSRSDEGEEPHLT
jgi:hypothetical protein